MPARLNPQQSERAKDAIRTTQLCKRLNGFALSEPDEQTGKPIEMSPAQVKAAVALLKKTLPDLQSIEGALDLHHHKHEEALKDLE
jgi:hypothetical protein